RTQTNRHQRTAALELRQTRVTSAPLTVYQGQRITVQVSLFGKLPPQPYFMEVLECDDEAMILRSSEKGAGVKSWHHTLTVEPQQSGSRLRDVIEIDAGWMSWAFALWARFLYRKRHEPRVQILADMRAKRSETDAVK
ncbi:MULTISPECIES: hypothetical protein, partial [unclassified Sulfitobacter]|uniref:hypothetical protein n=1 Tax=unclassified Sulfitobacter TaxID=196795 RepID=UPI0037465760